MKTEKELMDAVLDKLDNVTGENAWKIKNLWNKYLDILEISEYTLELKIAMFEIMLDMEKEYLDKKGQKW